MINSIRIEEIYDQMNGYILELGDPNAFGPRYFIDKIAICRNYLNAVSLVVSELSREKLVTGSELRKLEAVYELDSARLLSTDDAVRRLANIKDRESMVAYLLRDRKQRIDLLKGHIISIDAVAKAVAHRSRELHATMDAIKNQRRFMQIEVSTGSFYGDERLPAHETSVGIGSGGTSMNYDFNEAELNAIFNEEDGAVHELPAAVTVLALPEAITEEEPSQAPAIAAPQEPSTDDESAINAFLNEPVADKPSPRASQEEDDFSALLDTV